VTDVTFQWQITSLWKVTGNKNCVISLRYDSLNLLKHDFKISWSLFYSGSVWLHVMIKFAFFKPMALSYTYSAI
jgi:hypothetical protein